MITVYFFVNSCNTPINQLIEKLDDDEHIIHLYSDIVTSSENNPFFCLGELATQIFSDQTEKYFFTDNHELYNWVNTLYTPLLSKIEYIEQENDVAWNNSLNTIELLQYESSLSFNQDKEAQKIVHTLIQLHQHTDVMEMFNLTNYRYMGTFYFILVTQPTTGR